MTFLIANTKQLQRHIAWLDMTHLVTSNPSSNIAMLKPSQQFIKTLNSLTQISTYIEANPNSEIKLQKSLDQGIEIIITMIKENSALTHFLVACLESSPFIPYLKIKLNKIALRNFNTELTEL